jgi:excisionase family DNA binding protein
MSETPQLLTKAEAARRLRVSPSTVDRLRAHGELAWVAVGGGVRFRPEALADFVARAEHPARSEPAAPVPRARPVVAAPPAPGAERRRELPATDFDELFPIGEPPLPEVAAAR